MRKAGKQEEEQPVFVLASSFMVLRPVKQWYQATSVLEVAWSSSPYRICQRV
jgi:hypothetical protein